MKSKFVKSATELRHCPQDQLKEVVFLGRSNAGKSSLLNSLVQRKSLAKVSATPGKTRLINFFLINDSYRFVDLPGYGYAARSGAEQEKWGKFIENFLHHRPNIAGFILVMDIRRQWTDDEAQLYQLSRSMKVPGFLALTKSDKLSKTQQQKAIASHKNSCKYWEIFAVSSLKKTGVYDFHQAMYKQWQLGGKVTIRY